MRKYNKRRQLENECKYIDWNTQATKVNLKQEEFTKFYESLNKAYRQEGSKTKRIDWITGEHCLWRHDRQGDYEYIYWKEGIECCVYSTNYKDDEKNRNQTAGLGMHLDNGLDIENGLKILRRKFKETNNTSLFKAFGSVPVNYKICIPKTFNYHTEKYGLYTKLSSIDFGSMFPSCMCGLLPDSRTAIKVVGQAKPTEEYPFAFYLDTGHVAIYNEFDTHDWVENEWFDRIFRLRLTTEDIKGFGNGFKQLPLSEDTTTVLMKASKYQLTDIFKECYELRKVNKDAKLIMNSAIGSMHRKDINYKNGPYAHLAAVCLCRANQKMLNILTYMFKKDIIQICVDGIIYNSPIQFGVNEKGLGLPYQEYRNCRGNYLEYNRYIIDTPEGFKYRHAGCNYWDDGRCILNENDVTSIEDAYHWIYKETKTQQRVKENKQNG